ncbi:unnamed protein product [Cylicocyclus nassatus]|uniref:Uncharacterized protein n=1 Tax=Cylicocyclus nassatus TaxID=53992 RepID=A0AA36M4H5_CYLNA|nr:unnamed protein product [Cylicocyclus nassatus]
MQNDLVDPSISPGATPHVAQHVTVPSQPMSGPLSQTPSTSNVEQEQPDPNRARKVAEVFLTAGHAFQKLGDLAMQLQMGPSSIPTEERWSENNVEHLREALTRFAHELDQISNNVQARTTKMISTDIRRRHLMPQRPLASSISAMKRQPAKLGPVIVPKRLNVTRPRQYMPARLSTTPGISQVVVPTTKTYPMARAGTSTFGGQHVEHGLTPGSSHFGASNAGRCTATFGSTNLIQACFG